MQCAVSGGGRRGRQRRWGAQLVFCHVNFYIRGEGGGWRGSRFCSSMKNKWKCEECNHTGDFRTKLSVFKLAGMMNVSVRFTDI